MADIRYCMFVLGTGASISTRRQLSSNSDAPLSPLLLLSFSVFSYFFFPFLLFSLSSVFLPPIFLFPFSFPLEVGPLEFS